MHKAWHALSADNTINDLKSNLKTGLDQNEIKLRQAKHGHNELPIKKTRSIFNIFLHQFMSPLIYLLIIASFFALFIGDYKDAIVIIVVVLLNALVGSIQEGRAEQSLQALTQLSFLKAKVLRDGVQQEIMARELVPGDIISITAGDAIPSDARLISSHQLSVSEAALTGESLPINKTHLSLPIETVLTDRLNMIYAGTLVTNGRAVAVVTSIGVKNEIGKIAHLASAINQKKTQLEMRMAEFGKYIVIMAIILFFLILAIGLWRGFLFSQMFMIAIGQMVSIVPEGLPVAVTIALAVGVQRMAKKGTIVRRLPAVESLGSTSIICTDKTGTLTKNEMTVTQIYLTSKKQWINVTGVGHNPEGALYDEKNKVTVQINTDLYELILAGVLCNDAKLIAPQENINKWEIIGDPTEAALLTVASKAGLSVENIQQANPRQAEIPFDPQTKMMATLHSNDNGHHIYIKGAPESVLSLAGTKINGNDISDLKNAAQHMAKDALRVLAIARISNAKLATEINYEQLQNNIEILGLVGQFDPPRLEIKDVVKKCYIAGIKPIMVTGDHKNTAMAMGKTLGILKTNDLAIDGIELDKIDDLELLNQIDHITIFARVRPEQKLRIIQAFQAKGHVVAMTGDGVNDAPALVKADVGVAMGITGTEVAKEAAKIIITDDNFATIVEAVAQGRLVYQNIKKLILFLFVTSIDEVIILFLALIFGYPPPLAAVQILWINLVAEGALTVNLIMEPAEGNEMQKPPIAIHAPLLDRSLLGRIPLMVMASVISTFSWFVYRTSQGISPELVQTETFTALIVSQWFNVLNCRSETQSIFSLNLIKNPWLLFGLIFANIMQVLVIYWPPLAHFFHTVPIGANEFFQIGICASLVLWVEEIRKFFIRKKTS